MRILNCELDPTGRQRVASKCRLSTALLLMFLLCRVSRGQEQSPLDKINWVVGPAKVNLGGTATLNVPSGYRFTDANGARLWAEANQNPPNELEVGVLVPPVEVLGDPAKTWFVIFSYEDCGHVSDDEKLDADTDSEILNAIIQNTEKANTGRVARGWRSIKILGWQQEPFYDAQNHHLIWALALSSDGTASADTVNYSSRILGRTGVISANMVVRPNVLVTALPSYRTALAGVLFNSGNGYHEFRAGDKVAKYGLVGLITGGVAVAAVKLWGYLVKVGAVIVAAILAGLVKARSWFTSGSAAPAAGTTAKRSATQASGVVVKCPVCGQSNWTYKDGVTGPARCGKCKALLNVD
jgi:uncharacterized membrane-anchored protein